MNLRSLFVPMPTPFRGGEVDAAAIGGNVRHWMASGLGGIVALGTNGEAALLDEDEGVRVVEAARREIPADRVLVAGAGHESTRATITAAKRLAAAGADAVLVKTPYTYRAHVSAAGLIAHYRAVADASRVPVLLYNFPASTGVNLSPDTVAALAAHPNIAGMKETSTDGAQFADLSAAVPADFTVLCGAAPGVYAALCAGATGAIVAIAAIMPALCLELLARVRSHEYDKALAIQHQITPLARAVTTTHGIPGLKAALDIAGLRGGEPRPPLMPLADEARERIRTLFHAATTLHHV
ncbi:MAG TPA: dihydrodipicolinate synthase family protein [Vicinamibacterales bacterium]